MRIERVITYLSPKRFVRKIRDGIRKAHEYADLIKLLERRAVSEFTACNSEISAAKFAYADIPGVRAARQSEARPIHEPPRIAFVLLQYNHFEVTQEAIESIQRLEPGPIHEIVVVDNLSTDGSRARLQAYAEGKKNIHIVMADKNGGFAKGNNLGYAYAKRNLAPDFIVVANNDVVYPQDGFTKKIPEIYSSTLFSILGPDIRAKGDKVLHQNPLHTRLRTKEAMTRSMQKRIALLRDLGNAPLPSRTVLGRSKLNKKTLSGPIVLHGSAFILSPIFIADRDSIFDDRTFMYGEEDILATLAYARGHRMVYDPRIHVQHNVKGSTDTSDLLEYYRRSYAYHIDSAKIYIDVLTSLEQEGVKTDAT